MKPALPLHLYTERDWDHQLKQLCDQLGWTLNYHTLRSKGSRSGFPDRILVRERLIAVELKTEQGKVSDTQREWLDGLSAAGIETYAWKPSDLDEVAQILSKRWQFQGWSHRLNLSVGHGSENSSEWWMPNSLWIHGSGRADAASQQTINTAA